MNIGYSKLVFFSVLLLFGCEKTIEKKDVDTIAEVNNEMTKYPSASGKVGYFICDDGSDTNDGKTPYTPWQTFERGMSEFNYLNAGESIHFCRGGMFTVVNVGKLFNQNCTAELPCSVSDYFPPNSESNERPVLFSPNGDTVFRFLDGGDSDQDGGYVLKNLILESNVAKKQAIFLYNDVDDLTIDNLKIDGFRIGVHSAGSKTQSAGSNGNNERIMLKNSEIINNSDQGWLGGCTDCAIESNTFDNNGYARAVFNHNIYFGAKSGQRNISISKNTLKNSTIVNGKCSGVSLVVHGTVNNIRIEDNLIQEKLDGVAAGCWGISVDPGYGSIEEKFENVVIKGNTIINTGNLGIGCASCVNVIIESNKIINSTGFYFTGIKVPAGKEDSVKTSNVKIKNNQINIFDINNGKKKLGINIKNTKGDLTFQDNKLFSNNSEFICISVDDEIYDDDNSCKFVSTP